MCLFIPAYDYARWSYNTVTKPISTTIDIDICTILVSSIDAGNAGNLLAIGLVVTFPFNLVETSPSKSFQNLIHDSIQRFIVVRLTF